MSAAEVFPDPADDEFDGSGGGDGGHLEWRISALLDDELSPAESTVARDHLAGCPICQDEFAEVLSARDLVRELGEVDPPSGFIDGLIAHDRRRRRSRQLGIIGLLTLAGAWVLILVIGAGVTLPSVEPPIDEFISRHGAISTAAVGGIEVVDDPYVVPEVAGFDLVSVEKGDEGVHLVYRSDDLGVVSVFEQEGLLDWDELPDGGSEVELAGRHSWLLRDEGGRTLVVIPGETFVYTVVGPSEGDVTVDLAGALPDPPEFSLGDRVRRGFESVIERFGLD